MNGVYDDEFEFSTCPHCGHKQPTEPFDGVGVLICEQCGYCSHPHCNWDGKQWVCLLCGASLPQEVSHAV